ncbi:MAG TPA: diaminopimelate epimerase, partial [Saprospiraceae bacterium]|nr:diaminopimelate epimerase [Saprospiraceae bacterium]
MLKFYKYQGAGNDFIIFDNREGIFPLINRQKIITRLCDRRFGIGADGVMLLENAAGMDFNMIYFNADGNESSMCGNGGRCLVSFANDLGIIQQNAAFNAIDGAHDAVYFSPQKVNLRMKDVSEIQKGNGFAVLDTGSPHYVRFVDDLSVVNVYEEGRQIRYSPEFAENGINV